MRNNIEPILEFIILDENEAPVLNEQGVPTLKQAPIVKSIADLVAKGKVNNIDTFAKLQAQGEQWQWAREYVEYLIELKLVTEHNENIEAQANESADTEEGGENEALNLWEIPSAPVRPALKTVEQVLEPHIVKITKMKGIECQGIFISLTEANQNGLSALKSALELAKEFDVESEFFPVKFNAETSTGVGIAVFENEAEFKQFGLQFILARKSFFE